MRAFTVILALAASALAASSSGTPTGSAPSLPSTTAGISPCILTCSSQAATDAGCVSFTNASCVCVSKVFQNEAQACLLKNCTATDLTAALTLQSELCAGIAGSPSGSGSSSSSSPTQSKSAGYITFGASTALVSGFLVLAGGLLIAPTLLL